MRSPPGSALRTRPERSPMARWYGGIRATRATCSASSTSCGLTRLVFSASGHARAVKWRSRRESASLRLARQSWAQRCPTARRVNLEQTSIACALNRFEGLSGPFSSFLSSIERLQSHFAFDGEHPVIRKTSPGRIFGFTGRHKASTSHVRPACARFTAQRADPRNSPWLPPRHYQRQHRPLDSY
jgi:hypothetical protein